MSLAIHAAKPDEIKSFVARNGGVVDSNSAVHVWSGFLASNGGTGKNLPELEATFLASLGATGQSLQTLWANYLTANGYSSSFTQAIREFMQNGTIASSATVLFRDLFTTDLSAGSVNGSNAEPGAGTRIVTDTQSKISVSGGKLSCATKTAGWSDGVLCESQSITREAGVVISGEFTPSSISGTFLHTVTSVNTPAGTPAGSAPNNANKHAFYVTTSGRILPFFVGYNGGTCFTYVAGTTYKYAIVLRASGCWYYLKGGTLANWTLLHVVNSDTTATLYQQVIDYDTAFTSDKLAAKKTWSIPAVLASDNFNEPDNYLYEVGSTNGSAIPEAGGANVPYYGSGTMAISSNKVINSPRLGSELIINGGFDSSMTGWSALSGATIASVAGGQSGNCAQITNGTATQGYMFQHYATTVGKWYKLTFYHKNGTGTGSCWIGSGSTTYAASGVMTDASWTQKTIIFRAGLVAGTDVALLNVSTTIGDTTLFDTVSLKELTSFQDLITVVDVSKSNVVVSVDATTTKLAPTGIIMNLDSATTSSNFVLCYHDGVNLKLVKCVSGTYTEVGTATITPGASKKLMVIKNGTNYNVFYDGIAKYSAVIADAGIVSNTKHGMFLADPSDYLDNFWVHASGTDGEYNTLNSYVEV